MAIITEPYAGESIAELVQVWNACNVADPITESRFIKTVLMDINFDADGLLIAKRDGKIIGASYAVRRKHASEHDLLEPEKGWLLSFFVARRERQSGLGHHLVSQSVDWLEQCGAREVYFSSYTPNYLVPGLDKDAYPRAFKLLEDMGFHRQYEAAAMDRLLSDYRPSIRYRNTLDGLHAEGYVVRAARVEDLPCVLRLAGDHFNPDWERAIREAVVQGMPAENISIALDPTGTLVGWAMHGTYEGMSERFGPFGVLDSQRGKGLGRVLLHHCLQHMKASGAHSAWFLWTGEASPAGRLYLDEAFSTTRRFTIMKRENRSELGFELPSQGSQTHLQQERG